MGGTSNKKLVPLFILYTIYIGNNVYTSLTKLLLLWHAVVIKTNKEQPK